MRKNQENWWPKNYQASEVSDFFQGKTTASSIRQELGNNIGLNGLEVIVTLTERDFWYNEG